MPNFQECFSLVGWRLCGALSVLGPLLMPVTVANARAVANNNPAFLQVYVNNVENLTGTESVEVDVCRADYTDLIEYIKTQDYVPDIFIVQQISGSADAEIHAARLQSEFDPNWDPASPNQDYDYHFVIAEEVPFNDIGGTCANDKRLQTNAIFYRTARLTLEDPQGWAYPSIGSAVWQTKKWDKTSTPHSCVDNNQARTKAVADLFWDSLTGNSETAKRVAIGSMHWVTVNSGGSVESSVCNIERINEELNGLTRTTIDPNTQTEASIGADLIVFGGDTNRRARPTGSETTWHDWYERANVALPADAPEDEYGYSDPIYDLCQDLISGGTDYACLNEHISFIGEPTALNVDPPKRRIDFLFAKQPDTPSTVMTNQHTVRQGEADMAALGNTGTTSSVAYSSHLAIRSRVYYDDPLVFETPHPIAKPKGRTGESYPSATLADDVSGANSGEILSFSLLDGPDWLTLETDGSLVGTPDCGDIGLNRLRVKVESQSGRYDEADVAINVTDAGQPLSFACPRPLYLSEVMYDPETSTDTQHEWVELYNSAANPIDLSDYTLGYGGANYAWGKVELSGIIESGQAFVFGGPTSRDSNSNPIFGKKHDFDGNLQNATQSRADGVALFNLPAAEIASDSVPIDAVIYGTNNDSNLIDESAIAGAPDVGDANAAWSVERIDLVGTWIEQQNPTPNQTSLVPPGNQAPVVFAGDPQDVVFPNAAVLNGSVSDDDFPGFPLTITWVQVSGPAGSFTTFTPANSPTSTATFSHEGEYTLRLTGDDTEFNIPDDVVVTAIAVSPPNGDLVLSEILYDPAGDEGGPREWVELYNGTSAAIDLSGYSLGYGGTSYTYGVAQLSGIVEAGETFVVGGPTSVNNNGNPLYDQALNFSPNLQNSTGRTADGVALFDVPAAAVTGGTFPIDAVIYGTTNRNDLIDESGAANAPDVGDAPDGDSVERISMEGDWVIQRNPTPNTAHTGLLN